MTLDTTRRKVTTGTGVTLALAVATVAGSATGAAADETHTVRPGETLSHLSQRSGTSVAAIARANGLADPGHVIAGQKLVIPTTSAPTRARTATKATSASTHTVVSGDTVSHLAARYGTTVSAISKANSLDGRAFIRAGQVLAIPGRGGSSTPPSSSAPTRKTVTHTVRSGETVSSIAARYGTTVKAVVAANDLDSRALIRAGEKLTVPTASGSTQKKSSSKRQTSGLVGDSFAGRTYPKHVVAAANQNKQTLLDMGVPSRESMQRTVRSTAKAMGVDPALAQAIAFQESGFNHASVSPANAIGTMQVIPTSGDWASTLVGRDLNLLDPEDNVVAGVAILRQLRKSASDLPTAIAGYYQGASSVRKYGMFADTRRYVANVQTLMSRFS